MAKYENLIVEDHEGVRVIRLNRDDIRNALAFELVDDLVRALEEARDDPHVRVIILTGEGKAFCAGGHIGKFREQGSLDMVTVRDQASHSLRIYQTIPTLGKPLIGAVNGYALGGGCGLASACDLVIASDQAVFGYPEVQRGFVPGIVAVTLMRMVGRKKLFELLMLGERFDAHTAERLGLVNKVVPHEQLMEEAMAWARKLAGYSATALRLTRELLFQIADLEYQKALPIGRDFSAIARHTPDFQAGAHAFLSKSEKG